MNQYYQLLMPIISTIVMIIIPSNIFALDNNTNSNNHTKSILLHNISNNANTSSKNTFSDDHSNRQIKVVASFFPMFEFVKGVGGDRVQASVLIPIGSEPHDFDPTINQISTAQSADLIVYNGAGMESLWINKINPKFAVDTSQGLSLLSSSDKEAHNGVDPHIWLDPISAEHQVNMIRDALIKVDPKNAGYYKTNTQKFIAKLDALNSEIKSGLSHCNKKDFVSFHNAFNYFAHRYGLIQHPIQGLSPEGEILPQKIQEIIQLSNNLGINVIYSEDLVDPRSAQVIADEIPNGKVLVLSPIEGIKAEEIKSGVSYFDKMHQDLANLKIGLQCNTGNNKV